MILPRLFPGGAGEAGRPPRAACLGSTSVPAQKCPAAHGCPGRPSPRKFPEVPSARRGVTPMGWQCLGDSRGTSTDLTGFSAWTLRVTRAHFLVFCLERRWSSSRAGCAGEAGLGRGGEERAGGGWGHDRGGAGSRRGALRPRFRSPPCLHLPGDPGTDLASPGLWGTAPCSAHFGGHFPRSPEGSEVSRLYTQ